MFTRRYVLPSQCVVGGLFVETTRAALWPLGEPRAVMTLHLKPYAEQPWPRQRPGCQLLFMKLQDCSSRHGTVRVLAPHSRRKMSSHILAVSYLPASIPSLFLSWNLLSLRRSFASIKHLSLSWYSIALRAGLFILFDICRWPLVLKNTWSAGIQGRVQHRSAVGKSETHFDSLPAWTAPEGGKHKMAETTALHSC